MQRSTLGFFVSVLECHPKDSDVIFLRLCQYGRICTQIGQEMKVTPAMMHIYLPDPDDNESPMPYLLSVSCSGKSRREKELACRVRRESLDRQGYAKILGRCAKLPEDSLELEVANCAETLSLIVWVSSITYISVPY